MSRSPLWRILAAALVSAVLAAAAAGCSDLLAIGELPGGPGVDSGTPPVDASVRTAVGADATLDAETDATGATSAMSDAPAESAAPEGRCPSDTIDCDGGCVQGLKDGHNCGTCGHDCRGGGCLNGACEFTVFAADQAGADAIVASDAGVFWVDQGDQVDGSTIRGCPLAGCDGGPTTLAAGQNTLLALAADDTTVFWGSGDDQGTLGISSCPVTGCATPTTVASQPLSALSIAVDPATVYWTDGDTLWACPRTGCTGSPTVLTTNLQRAASLTVSDGAVYWANTSGNTIASCSTPACGSGVTTVETVSGQPVAVAAADSTLFYAAVRSSNAQVYSCDAGGCGASASLLCMGQSGSIQAIQVDGPSVYWDSDGVVSTCPRSGCGADENPTGVTGAAGIVSFAVHDGVLYWTDSTRVLEQVL